MTSDVERVFSFTKKDKRVFWIRDLLCKADAKKKKTRELSLIKEKISQTTQSFPAFLRLKPSVMDPTMMERPSPSEVRKTKPRNFTGKIKPCDYVMILLYAQNGREAHPCCAPAEVKVVEPGTKKYMVMLLHGLNERDKVYLTTDDPLMLRCIGESSIKKNRVVVYEHHIINHIPRDVANRISAIDDVALRTRHALDYAWRNVVFRMVDKCVPHGPNMIGVRQGGVLMTRREYATHLPEMKGTDVCYFSDYDGYTAKEALRENDTMAGTAIYFDLERRADFLWSFEGEDRLDIPPGRSLATWVQYEKAYIPPRKGMYVCGILADKTSSGGNKRVEFKKWTVVPVELLFLWTMVRRGPVEGVPWKDQVGELDCTRHLACDVDNLCPYDREMISGIMYDIGLLITTGNADPMIQAKMAGFVHNLLWYIGTS